MSATQQAASRVLLDIDQSARQASVWNLSWDLKDLSHASWVPSSPNPPPSRRPCEQHVSRKKRLNYNANNAERLMRVSLTTQICCAHGS